MNKLQLVAVFCAFIFTVILTGCTDGAHDGWIGPGLPGGINVNTQADIRYAIRNHSDPTKPLVLNSRNNIRFHFTSVQIPRDMDVTIQCQGDVNAPPPSARGEVAPNQFEGSGCSIEATMMAPHFRLGTNATLTLNRIDIYHAHIHLHGYGGFDQGLGSELTMNGGAIRNIRFFGGSPSPIREFSRCTRLELNGTWLSNNTGPLRSTGRGVDDRGMECD